MDMSKYERKQMVLGKEMSYLDLKAWEVVKTYEDTNHDTNALVKDPDGGLWYYNFHEEMGFPDDVIVETWVSVPNEEFADENWHKNIFFWKSINRRFITVGPSCEIKVSR